MIIQESGEMYLETIYRLSRVLPVVRSIDVSEYIGYSKPSVSRAIGILKTQGLITVDPAGSITLTDTGKERAVCIYERHTVLTKMFVLLGVDEQIAAEDACRLEHYISNETFQAVKRHLAEHLAEASRKEKELAAEEEEKEEQE